MNTIVIATVCLAVLIIAGTTQAETVNDLLANSKPGDTVSLGAGTFDIGSPLALPKGVSLRGAGYGKTILAAKGDVGLRVSGANGGTVSDLSIRGASIAIVVEESANVAIERVLLARNVVGTLIARSKAVIVRNSVMAGGRIGPAIARELRLYPPAPALGRTEAPRRREGRHAQLYAGVGGAA